MENTSIEPEHVVHDVDDDAVVLESGVWYDELLKMPIGGPNQIQTLIHLGVDVSKKKIICKDGSCNVGELVLTLENPPSSGLKGSVDIITTTSNPFVIDVVQRQKDLNKVENDKKVLAARNEILDQPGDIHFFTVYNNASSQMHSAQAQFEKDPADFILQFMDKDIKYLGAEKKSVKKLNRGVVTKNQHKVSYSFTN